VKLHLKNAANVILLAMCVICVWTYGISVCGSCHIISPAAAICGDVTVKMHNTIGQEQVDQRKRPSDVLEIGLLSGDKSLLLD